MKVHKLPRECPKWHRKDCQCVGRRQKAAECGAELQVNYSENWRDVTCQNCLRDMGQYLDADSLIADVNWPVRVRHALAQMNGLEPMSTLRDLSQRNEIELLVSRNCGIVSVMEVRRILREAKVPPMKQEL